MTGVVIEAGVYFLLFFLPLAFAGVEGWALGVLQILCGIVTAAWAVDRFAPSIPARPRPRQTSLMLPIVLFGALGAFQLIPLPPSLVSALSPASSRLYGEAIPGYAREEPFETKDLVPWVLADQAGAIPKRIQDLELTSDLTATLPASSLPRTAPVRRTLSLYPHQTRQTLTVFLCMAGIFAACLHHFTSRERLLRLAVAGTSSAVVVSILGIAQKATWNGKIYWVREVSTLNVFGPFVNRNTYAAFAGVWLPVAACMALAALRRRRMGHSGQTRSLILWSLAAAALTGGIFISLSRGGIVSSCLSLLIVLAGLAYFGMPVRDLGMVGAVMAAGILILVWTGPDVVMERIGTLVEGQAVPSFQSRVDAWKEALRLVEDYPILGAGLGTFRYAFMRYAPPGENWWNTAHNEYLELLCDSGMIGAALVAWLACAWLIRIARPASIRHRRERHLLLGMVAGLAALFLHSAVSSNLQVPAAGFLVPMLAAATINLMALVARSAGREGAMQDPP